MNRWTILSLLLLAGTIPSAASVAEAAPPVEKKEPELVQNDDKKNATTSSEEEPTCAANSKDGTCLANATTTSSTSSSSSPPLECGLYLAKSAIPMAGWGMYTGYDIADDSVIPPVDVVIPVYDIEIHRERLHHYQRLENTMGYANMGDYIHSYRGKKLHRHNSHPKRNNTSRVPHITKLPKWLMHQYYWDCGMTHNYYDAEHIDSVVPGLGMLANSHPGMVLAENVGPARPLPIGGRGHPGSTPYQDQSFVALQDIVAGHELFVEYGDDWFAERFDETFGLSRDYRRGNTLAGKWQTSLVDRFSGVPKGTEILQDLSTLMLDMIQPFNPRLHAVLSRLELVPKPDVDFTRLEFQKNPTAYASVPDSLRSLEWLQEEGLCLDHLAVGNSTVAPGERGAFASRLIPKGTVVAPAPVVHMSRDHLTMLLTDNYDSDILLWKGYQLLLNYVYGHVESSLLFFPYANAVNLINHYGGKDKESNRRPNVKLQWSSKMPHPEWLESWTPEQIVEVSEKAGMVMEIVALEDIREGGEILLNYGNSWQEAFDEHSATTPPPPDLPEVDWEAHTLLTVNDEEQYPGFVETVCWIDEDQKPFVLFENAGHDESRLPQKWLAWEKTSTQYLSDSMSCSLVGKKVDGNSYNVLLQDNVRNAKGEEVEIEIKITGVPRSAITIVPLMYTNPELRRDAFRHEIQLPEEMVPEHWRDLREDDVVEAHKQCNLYMAESAIPNAGLGLYRGYATPMDPEANNELDAFCRDMIIQVEDFDINQELRNRFQGKETDLEMDNWMLTQYSWVGSSSKGGNLEAEEIQSYSPGCGMLANSHPLLYNSHMLPPVRKPVATVEASLGATTHYHNALFVEQYLKKGPQKVRTLQNGMEIFAKYGDDYFIARESVMGKVPLKKDYVVADKLLQNFLKLKTSHDEKVLGFVWKLLWKTIEGQPLADGTSSKDAPEELLKEVMGDVDPSDIERVGAALPKNMGEAARVMEQGGCAASLLPDRVRSPEWLEQHGSCADNLRVGESTEDLAGRGAFATREISKRQVVAPLPMLHLHRDHLDIYNSEDINDPEEPVFLEGKQLLLNYCYGHPDSSLLLFPYSPTVNYINHAPSSRANAKLQWSSNFNKNDWLQMSPNELLRKHKQAGLAMEIVATRDIVPGEEVFLDYGSEYEQAWENHTSNWKLDDEWDYEPPDNQWLEWVPTREEINSRKLNVQHARPDKFLGCHVVLPEEFGKQGEDLPDFQWTMVDGMFRTTQHVFPCEITERVIGFADEAGYQDIRKESVSPTPEVYTAIVTVDSGDESTPPQQFISYDMPRRAIEVFDEEYAAPQFYRQAFRHEIGIPDYLFPKAWRDLKA